MPQHTYFKELREQWETKGSLPRDHPEVELEYYLSAHTGNSGRMVCGAVPVEPKRY